MGVQLVLVLLLQTLHRRRARTYDRVALRRLLHSIFGFRCDPVRLIEHECHSAAAADAKVLSAHIRRTQGVQIVWQGLQDGSALLLREGDLSGRVPALGGHGIFLVGQEARAHLADALLVVLKHLLAIRLILSRGRLWVAGLKQGTGRHLQVVQL